MRSWVIQNNLTNETRLKGAHAYRKQAASNENNWRAWAMINMMISSGKNYVQIAEQLNLAGFPMARGYQFLATQLMRLYRRTQAETV